MIGHSLLRCTLLFMIIAGLGTSGFAYASERDAVAKQLSIVDASTGAGRYNDVTIGSDGLPIISYNAETTEFFEDYVLKVAHCNNAVCSSATSTVLDRNGGQYTSIAIGQDGLAIISYFDLVNRNLKVAHCRNVVCSAADITTLDSAGVVGADTSIAIGSDGLAVISYRDTTNGNLKLAHCSNVACTAASTNNVGTQQFTDGLFTSLAIGSDGFPIISYYYSSEQALRVAHCTNITCTQASHTQIQRGSIGSPVGEWSSIAIGSDGLPIISYVTGAPYTLRVAHCRNVACTGAADLATLDDQFVQLDTSIAIGSDGLAIISYQNERDDDLRVAHCRNVTCSAADLVSFAGQTLDADFNAIAIGRDGLPLITFWRDIPTISLLAVHCETVSCVAAPVYRSFVPVVQR